MNLQDLIKRGAEYFDEYGLLRMARGIPVENGPLFRARYETVFGYWNLLPLPYTAPVDPHTAIRAITDITESFKTKRYKADPPDHTDHFSRDNMYGLYILCYIYAPHLLKELPLMFWNNRKNTGKITPWLHPNGWTVFLALRSKAFSWIFLVPILIMMKYSFADTKRNPTDTSGTCLWLDMIPLLAKQNKVFFGIYMHLLANDFEWILDTYNFYCSNGYTYDNATNPIRVILSLNYNAIIEKQ